MPSNTIILDACLIITFGNVGKLSIVTELGRYNLAVAATTIGEVKRPPAVDQLQHALQGHGISPTAIDLDVAAEQEALVRYSDRRRFKEKGEAETLALAASRGWVIGSDEVAVQRVAIAEFGPKRVAGTLDFLRWAVLDGRLSVVEASVLLERLDVGPGLLKRIVAAGSTIQDLVSRPE